MSFFDIFSPTPGLKINKEDKLTTIFGIIVSLMTILFISIITIYYSLTCFSRKNFKILERMDNKIVPTTKISENKISFIILDSDGKQFLDQERLFTIEANFWEIFPLREIEDRTVKQKIPVTNCSIYFNEPFEDDYRKALIPFPTTQCLDFKDLKKELYGTYGSIKG